MTIFPIENATYVLISYFKEDRVYFRKFISQLEQEDNEVIKFYFNMILPLHTENIILSPELWKSWNEKKKRSFIYYNNLNGQEWIMEKAISFALKNHRTSKKRRINNDKMGMNLFE